jgi:predicted anti-sigma-YlaC factor YlaD
MNDHLNDDETIAYIHRTLTDDQREGMDRHMADCPSCRARLGDQEALQQHIRYSLLADLKAVRPPEGMGFRTIAPHLERRRSIATIWQPLLFGVNSLMAVTGLVIASLGSIGSIREFLSGSTQISATPLPLVASFLFAIPVLGNYLESRLVKPRMILSTILSFILWIGTAIVGLQNIIDIRKIFVVAFARLGGSFHVAYSLSYFVVFISALLWIVMVIGGGEYHYRRIGQRSSWKLFAWMIAGQLSILILSHFI